MGDHEGVEQEHKDRAEWVADLPDGPPEKDALAKIVDAAGGSDDAENSYYEAFADPQFVKQERDRRRYRGSYLRRLRRLASRSRDLEL